MYLAIPANGPGTAPDPHAKAAALEEPLNPSPERPVVQETATHVSNSFQADVVNPANKGVQPAVTPATPRAKHADIISTRGFSDAGNPDPEVPPPTKLAGIDASRRKTEVAAPPPVVTQRKDPEIVRLEQPRLSDAALQSRTDEQVIVTVQLSPEGKPLQASIVKSSNSLFNDAVIEAVMGSVYSPGIGSSGPITTWMTIPFKFKQ
jgi:TonB family protein